MVEESNGNESTKKVAGRIALMLAGDFKTDLTLEQRLERQIEDRKAKDELEKLADQGAKQLKQVRAGIQAQTEVNLIINQALAKKGLETISAPKPNKK